MLNQSLALLFCFALSVHFGSAQEEASEAGSCEDSSGQSHELDSFWDDGQVRLKCIRRKENVFAKPVSCIKEDGEYVDVGKSEKVGDITYGCVRDGEHTCSLRELKVSRCYDHDNQAHDVGDTWNDDKFRYSCVVNEANEAVTKIAGVIIHKK